MTARARSGRTVNRPAKPTKSSRSKAGEDAAKSHIKTLSDHEITTGRCVLIHGPTGAGKTVLALNKAPRPILVLDCDIGLDSVYGTKGSDKIHIWGSSDEEVEMDWPAMDRFRDYVVAGDWALPYEVIVVDNLTAGQKPLITWAIQEGIDRIPDTDEGKRKRKARDPDVPSQQDWGKIYRVYDRWVRDIKSAKRRGVHVIFTAGTREWMDEVEGYTRLMPNLEGAERNQIATHMDAVGYMEAEDDGRTLAFGPSGATITKVRLPVAMHGKELEILQNPDFDDMIRVVEVIAKKEASPKATASKRTNRRRTR